MQLPDECVYPYLRNYLLMARNLPHVLGVSQKDPPEGITSRDLLIFYYVARI